MDKEPYETPTISVDDFGTSDVITASVPDIPTTYSVRENQYFSFFDI
ncbi:MAG: hypothetical protein ACI4HM_04770 [Ruminococcus sp.]